MNDILDDFSDERLSEFPYDKNLVNDRNMWWRILTHPREVFNFGLSEMPLYSLFVIYGIMGLPAITEKTDFSEFTSELSWMNSNPILGTIAELLLFAVIILVFSFLLTLIGRGFEGKGSFLQIFAVYGWASIPMIPVTLINFYLYVAEYFGGGGLPSFSTIGEFGIWKVMYGSLNFVSFIWSMVLSVIGVAVAHQFSTGKSFTVHLVLIGIFLAIGLAAFMYMDIL